MKALENLPTYEIASKAESFGSLSHSDIDVNLVNNIDSRYYSAHEFKNLKIPDSFNIFHSNLDGLESKFDALHDFVNTTTMELDVICLSETSQKLNQDFMLNTTLEGYNQPFTTGSKFMKGGVAIYTKNNFNATEREDLKKIDDCFEAIWIEINVEKSKNIVCGCVYRHPNTDISIFENYINKCLTKLAKEKKDCYLAGDFNIDLLKYETSNKHRDFLNMMTSLGYLPLIMHPTRITEFTSTIIDNIYSNNLIDVSKSGNILMQFADHLAQFCSNTKDITRIKPSNIYRRDFSKFDNQTFIDDISTNICNLDETLGTNEAFDKFLSNMEDCIDRHAPTKKLNKKLMRKMAKPWLDNKLIKMINHRERLFRRKKADPNNINVLRLYKLFRNRVNRENSKAKKAYYKKYFEDNLNNIKNTWKGIKNILNLNKKNDLQVTNLHYEGKNINSNTVMKERYLFHHND